MDNKELFTCKSDDYSRYRPSYPEAAVDWLRTAVSGESVVDIGAGTGLFTQRLQGRFQKITAVEPNEDMRQKFSTFLPDIFCSPGSGEATLLPDKSVDLITAAQAFHWLDEELFKKEAKRILRPGGKVAIIWNTSLENDFTRLRNQICRKYCPRFSAGHAGKRSPAEGDAFLRYTYFRKVEVLSFANPFIMDQACFEGNMRSRSYALPPTDCRYEQFMSELHHLFQRFAENGTVTDPQETRIYLGNF